MVRRRVWVWLGWPALVLVAAVSVLHFVRYRLGRDVFWEVGVADLVVLAVVVLGPPLAWEVWRRRNPG